jgi:C-terminal processing protease CtpA/Prc
MLASELAKEVEQRRRIEEQLAQLTTQLAALRGEDDAAGPVTATASLAGNTSPTDTAATAAVPSSPEEGVTAMERALVAAGIDARTVAEIKQRRDHLALSEIYLRDTAVREGWLDTPRFADELAEIQRQSTSIRDEIGDEGYDRYLAALDHPNRVAVDEVLVDSPAALAGFQAGDVVLRYGDTRIFAPNELVDATRSGVAGETVPVQIIRNGQRFEIEVPRGPLGLRIAASRGDPSEG